MFTGIIEEIGKIRSISSSQLTVSARKVLENTRLGDSVAVNGVCLTVIDVKSESFSVELMPETIHRTNFGRLQAGHQVNLERALAIGGRIGGHFVQGHIDGTGQVSSLIPEGNAVLASFKAPAELIRYIVEKGFIAVDGVSLTVVKCNSSLFSVSLVTYSRSNTILGQKRVGDQVNIEVDILAKYVDSLRDTDKPGITLEFLADRGF